MLHVASEAIMRAVCSYCRADLGSRAPLDDPSLTHGMCRDCYDRFKHEWYSQRVSRLLETSTSAVILVSPEVRVVGASRAADTVLGRSPDEVVGLLGGEALYCVRAHTLDACGTRPECNGCVLRNAIRHTAATGQPLSKVPTVIERPGQTIPVTISTELEGDLVRVTLAREPPVAQSAAAVGT